MGSNLSQVGVIFSMYVMYFLKKKLNLYLNIFQGTSISPGMVLPSQESESHLDSLFLHLDSLFLLFFNAYKRKRIKLDFLFCLNGQFWTPYLVNSASQLLPGAPGNNYARST